LTREKSFDEERVLEKIMHVFWKKGYVSTSYTDLIKASGLTKPSLYNAFGNKEKLFLHCLEYFTKTIFSPLLIILLDENLLGVVAVQKFFHELINLKNCHLVQNGCLIINTIMEASSIRNKSIQKAACSLIENMEETITLRLREGKASNSTKYKEAPKVSQFIVNMILGSRLRSKVSKTTDFNFDFLDVYLNKIIEEYK
jgi:TetR/AcrR family transcriptional repressor of nem operon